MSWLSKLYEAYDAIAEAERSKGANATLLPILHITQGAHIEISIDRDGNFITASAIPKDEKQTVLPVTYVSKGRTNSPAPHALYDSLLYLAGDLRQYVGGAAMKKAAEYNNLYAAQLNRWADDSDHPMLRAIRAYLSKNTVIADLVAEKVLFADESQSLILEKKRIPTDTEKIPDVYKTELSDVSKAFVRFSVSGTRYLNDRADCNRELQEDWIRFYKKQMEKEKTLFRGRCAVTGEETLCTLRHAKNLRYAGDGAKLISSNDQSVVTFRGRFNAPEEVVNLGFEVSEKAHNALIWLIENQKSVGKKSGLTVIAFTTKTAFHPFDEDLDEDEPLPTTGAQYARILKRRFTSLADDLKTEGAKTGLQILALASATPGRMSVNLYREFDAAEDYFDHLLYWHRTFAWDNVYRKSGRAYASPPLWMVFHAVYGENADEKIKTEFYERILSCMTERRAIPIDMVTGAFHRTINRQSFNSNWDNALNVTCALINKYHIDCKKEEFKMALDESRNSRDYLFGRLLAVAEQMEGTALFRRNEKRETAAERYFRAYFAKPVSTWRQINLAFSNYVSKSKLSFYERDLGAIMSKLNPEYMTAKWDKPLHSEALIGYYQQRAKYFEKNDRAETQPLQTENEIQNENE